MPIPTIMTWFSIVAVLVGVVAVCLAILSEGEHLRRAARRPPLDR